MNALKKAKLSLVVIVLTSCSTLENVHVDAECLGLPTARLTDKLSGEEIDNLTDSAADAIFEHIVIYQERINSQCELLERHNKAHDN